ncbi:MAG: sugar phosphate isomerase/epimerase family protein [Gemmatimonadaceae bacterium]
MTSRRDAVKRLAAMAAAGLLPGAARAMAGGRASIARVGLQLYTVRAAMKQDVAATLQAVAQIGYKEVEFAGYFGHAPADIRRMLDDNGLTSPSCHLGLEAVQGGFDATAEAAHAVGHEYLTVASLDRRTITTVDDWTRVADAFNEAGRRAKAAGLRFAYHNHDAEFTPVGGEVPMEILIGGTDPSLVAYEMDLYWITKAGIDPRTYFARFPGRFEMVHVKDSKGPPGNEMAAVGSGTIDWKGIFARRKQAGIRHYFVEHDQPADPMASVRASYAYLEALRF